MMCREDLADKNFTSYKVCEEHFNEQDILPCQQVKRLKTTAIPTTNLPYLLKEDAETQTTNSYAEPRSETVQTEKMSKIHKNTQTNQVLLYRTATVKKLKRELGECQRQLRLNEINSKNPKIQRAILRKLSDNLLSKQLAMVVKANADLKCDKEYIQFCLNLYDTSPAAYCFLRDTLAMPSPVTLMKLKTEIPTGSQTTTSTNTNNFTHTLYASLGVLDFAATSDDFDETDAINLEDFDVNSGGFDAMTSNTKYADASTSTTTDKLQATNTSNLKTTAFTETINSASSPEASSCLRSALCAAKSKTVKENNLEAKTSTNTNNSVAMIICDIPPTVPPEHYDPLENIM
ncbi:uncharacterized protein LOC121728343 isoform X2 [Aricia agestis]|nr:uncharacterized protein LOC121728343 isoform X2 [Aricia agestis]